MPTKKRPDISFEVEGYFPVGSVSQLLKIDPRKWDREWRFWFKCDRLYEARQTLRAGKYLCHRTCPLSYTDLRIVRIDKKGRTVIK